MDLKELDLVDALVEETVLAPARREAVIHALVHPPARSEWAWFLYAAGLGFGVSLALAGVLYLVAFNWNALGILSKEIALFLGLGLASGVAVWKKPDSLLGQLGCAAAVVFAGAALVVYSQVYQSGADPWQLFALWSVLALPFVLAARTPGLWALQFVLLDTTLATGFDPEVDGLPILVWTAAGVAHVGLGQLWAGSWLQHVLRVAGLAVLVPLAAWFVLDFEPWSAAPALLAVTVGGLLVQLGFVTRLAAAPTATLSYIGLVVVGFTLAGRWLVELDPGLEAALLLLGFSLALVCGGGFVWLLGVPRLLKAEVSA